MSEQQTKFGFGVTLHEGVDQAIERVTSALKEEGFGVLTTINVQQTLKEKLGEDIEPYVILGACNPGLAHRALGADPNVGLLLPCNVVVRQEGNSTRVEIVDPISMLDIVKNPAVESVASEAKERLQRVAKQLEGK